MRAGVQDTRPLWSPPAAGRDRGVRGARSASDQPPSSGKAPRPKGHPPQSETEVYASTWAWSCARSSVIALFERSTWTMAGSKPSSSDWS